jgi:hypothetical protein
MDFAVTPRVGELIAGLGKIISIVHYPSPPDDPHPESRIHVFVRKSTSETPRT